MGRSGASAPGQSARGVGQRYVLRSAVVSRPIFKLPEQPAPKVTPPALPTAPKTAAWLASPQLNRNSLAGATEPTQSIPTDRPSLKERDKRDRSGSSPRPAARDFSPRRRHPSCLPHVDLDRLMATRDGALVEAPPQATLTLDRDRQPTVTSQRPSTRQRLLCTPCFDTSQGHGGAHFDILSSLVDS